MRISDFDVYRDLLKEKSGLSLSPDKSYLLDSRLTPVVKKWECETIDNLTMMVRGVPDPELIKDIVEAMTSSETCFFRDLHPFTIFRTETLPALLEKRNKAKKIRIWSTAASTGQEPYSIAMILKECETILSGWEIEIFATDISTTLLNQAKLAEYTQFEVQRGLPIQILMKYFHQHDEKWHLNDEIKQMVNYQYFNLLDSMGSLGEFDIILCRNVLSYFDTETQKMVLDNINNILSDDGYLILGESEETSKLYHGFLPLEEKPSHYIKSSASDAQQDISIAKALAN